MQNAPRLLVGLGNPKDSYYNTRHNVGRQFIDFLQKKSNAQYLKSRSAEIFRIPAFFRPHEDVICARPLSFMNESGPALKKLMEAENIPLSDVVVVVDDFMIPFGSLRLRPNGSAGGHNGVKSIIEV